MLGALGRCVCSFSSKSLCRIIMHTVTAAAAAVGRELFMFDVGKAGECMQVGTRVCLTIPHVCTLYFPVSGGAEGLGIGSPIRLASSQFRNYALKSSHIPSSLPS